MNDDKKQKKLLLKFRRKRDYEKRRKTNAE